MTEENLDFKTMYDHELYRLLIKTLPAEFRAEDGRLAVNKLAERTGLHKYTIYRWFKNENMSAASAKKLVSVCDNSKKNALKVDMLTKFIIGA